MRPMNLGGLGILDLEKFSRALRMRWMWYRWDSRDRPWKHLLKISDGPDMQLFFCSTEVQVGNGRNTSFWEARWLYGAAPRELTPNLYSLARFKKRSMASELNNLNWVRNLGHVNTLNILEEFTMLFMALDSIQLHDHNDLIRWRWTSNGKFSVSSAYKCQSGGSLALFPTMHVWQAKVELKCKFFAWLVLHNKLLTAENMIKRNWECDEFCSLYLCIHETASHLLTECNFMEAVWNLVAHIFALPNYGVWIATGGPKDWVQKLLCASAVLEKIRNLGILFMTWWEIWKESNCRIFEQKCDFVVHVSNLAIDQVGMWDQAFVQIPED
jgi:hypothetical protein